MKKLYTMICCLAALVVNHSHAIDVGSDGSDGEFAPLVDRVLTLPSDGIFRFTDVSIPAGVRVTFEKNSSNTPVVFLVSGDVVVAGTIDVSGLDSGSFESFDPLASGKGGPGGFDGGNGGPAVSVSEANTGSAQGGWGLGPGGGAPGAFNVSSSGYGVGCAGRGGEYTTAGGAVAPSSRCGNPVGRTYGNESLIPLIGGSGGGGGAGAIGGVGRNGGGGGGAIMIAANGSIEITGMLLAQGGVSGDRDVSSDAGGCGGGGSGGAIRLVAETIFGEGAINANPAARNCVEGAVGGEGRVRLEANQIGRSSPTEPLASISAPQVLFVPNFPTVSIVSIGGIAAPSAPTGMNDVVLPFNTPNPVTVELQATQIPLGTEVEVTIIPRVGNRIIGTSSPLAGTSELSTGSVSMDLPEGSSTILAAAEFTTDPIAAREYAPYADGQLVARVRSSVDARGRSVTTFITEHGDEYDWPTASIGIN